MSDSFWMSLFSCVATIALAWMQSRLRRDIRTVKHEINSKMDQLVEVTRSDALQQGHSEGVSAERKRDRDSYRKGEQP
jgi:hypothetical protein